MLFKSPLPNQTIDIYSLLLQKGPLNAEQISKELNIFPHAVYRSTDQLKSLGCVGQLGKHPALFEAQPVNESVETFTLLQREWFLKAFLANQKNEGEIKEGQLNLSFIESRINMQEKEINDLENAKDEVNLLVSGDELPAELMFALKKAIDRGVRIQEIVQKNSGENNSVLQARKKMGMHLRYHQPVNARLLVFDRKIVYFMSYEPGKFFESNGIRFEYAPIGQLMNALFMQYWEKGKEL